MNIPYVMKKCNTCGKWLVASSINFNKEKRGKYGLRGQCKKCKKEYRKENRDKIKEYQREYRKENRDKVNEYQREYRKENRDKVNERQREYYKENEDKERERCRKYREENKDKERERCRKYNKNNPEKTFNRCNKRRIKEENQGRGINKEQYIECNNWFGWKCAYSEEKIKNYDNSTYGRTLDHIVAIDNGGLNEPWNLVPMRKGYNSSKNATENSLDWYMEQEYFDIERLNKIVEWQKYAYEKWGGEEFGELILITDLVEEVKNYE